MPGLRPYRLSIVMGPKPCVNPFDVPCGVLGRDLELI